MSPSLKSVTDILSELFTRGLGYNALNTARNALYNIIDIDHTPVGKHPTIVSFIKEILNLKLTLLGTMYLGTQTSC